MKNRIAQCVCLGMTATGIATIAFIVSGTLCPGTLRAQTQPANTLQLSTPADLPRTKQPANQMTLAELTAADTKFRRELGDAKDAFDGEQFVNAEQRFGQTATEIDEYIKRIAAATMPKGSIETDGVVTPVTVETETASFTRMLEKARRGKDAASAMQPVADLQKRAVDLLIGKQYPEALDEYKKSAEALDAVRARIDDATFQLFLTRAGNGEKASSTGYWSKEFGRLRDQYNRTTEEPKMSPEQIRRTIQSVADEIVSKSYTDPAKHPDMPDDARALFHNLLDAANQYLASQ
jgi:hypothetical protein